MPPLLKIFYPTPQGVNEAEVRETTRYRLQKIALNKGLKHADVERAIKKLEIDKYSNFGQLVDVQRQYWSLTDDKGEIFSTDIVSAIMAELPKPVQTPRIGLVEQQKELDKESTRYVIQQIAVKMGNAH